MSRHRNVRNLTLDDYDDGYDDYEMSEEEEEELVDSDTAQYLWRNDHDQSFPNEQRNSQLQDDLVERFQEVLGVQLDRSSVDAALISADNDADHALELLRLQIDSERNAQLSAPVSNQLLNDQPSSIAQMLTDEQSEVPELPPSIHNEQQKEPALLMNARTALMLSHTEKPLTRPFDFTEPSPDDLVQAKQSKGRVRKTAALNSMPPEMARLNVDRGNTESSKPLDAQSSPTLLKLPGKRSELQRIKPAKLPAAATKTLNRRRAKPSAASVQREDTPRQKKELVQRIKKIDLAGAVKKRDISSTSIVVAGHVDAGKSTLLGHLLKKVGGTQSRGRRVRRVDYDNLAWRTDEDAVEREKGVTIDICTRIFETNTDGTQRRFAMVDAPGHRDFVPAMILGAMQASAAVLVVDASRGEFEAGISDEGQTREHALLLRSMGVTNVVVAVNKMDTVDYALDRYKEVIEKLKSFLRSAGWRIKKDVAFLPVAGRTGVNLIQKPEPNHALSEWYNGPTFLSALETLADTLDVDVKQRRQDLMSHPTRLLVADSYRSASLGGVVAVSGRLLAGSIAPRDKLLVCPSAEVATIKNIEIGDAGKADVAMAGVDNWPVSMGLTDISDSLVIHAGSVLCDPASPVPVVTRFKAQVVVVAAPIPLLQGMPVDLHVGGGSEAATLHKLHELVSTKGRGSVKKRPRRLVKGDTAVVDIKCDRPVCLERAADFKALGRFTLRCSGKTVAAGIVTEIVRRAQIDCAGSGEGVDVGGQSGDVT